MFQGSGGMLVAGVACKTCHKIKEVSTTGTVIWRASASMCATCHSDAHVERLRQYHIELRGVLAPLEANVKRLRAALVAGSPEKLAAELDRISGQLAFVRKANDIHNMHYASGLLRKLLKDLSAVAKELKAPPPDVVVPPPPREYD